MTGTGTDATPRTAQPAVPVRASLADGRDILYFTDSRDPQPAPRDQRPLDAVAAMSELRFDPLADEWVVVAAHRQSRTHLPATEHCPLCPSSSEHLTEVPGADFDVVVFENRFPALRPSASPTTLPAPYCAAPGAGRCEVVVFTSDHEASFRDLSPDRVRTVVDVWANRTEELRKLPGVVEVFCFENRGVEIGVTLPHPHGQIYAYPFATPTWTHALTAAARHRTVTGRNLFADVLASERAAGERLVTTNEHWTAFVPAAARWPFEVHVYPSRHVVDLPSLTAGERDAFATLYLDVLRRLDAVYGVPMPYVSAWHQAPTTADSDLAYLHLRLHSTRRAPGKLKYLAGSEAAMGVFINDIAPEDAAAMLRGATR